MSSSNLIRWSGLAALLGGVLFVIFDAMEFILFGNQPYNQAAGTGVWVIVQTAYIIVFALIGLGLVGLYINQAEQAGSLGLVAFLVAFLGGFLTAGSTWGEAYWSAWVAETAPQLLDTDPEGVLIVGAVLTFAVFVIGWLLFGLASLRAGVLPRASSILVMLGVLLFLVGGFLELPFAGILFGAAVAWMGYTLWSGSDAAEGVSIPEAA